MEKELHMKDVYKFYENKEEHYPNTDNFIHEYQQRNVSKESYLAYAIETGHMIYRRMGEPNQKWHLLESWYHRKQSDNPDFSNQKVTSWCNLTCPELLIWMAEAAGLDGVEDVVKEILNDDIYSSNDRFARNKMSSRIKEKLAWEMIVNKIAMDASKSN